MNYYDPNVIAALQRAHLKFFLMKTFELLHPGAPPLHLAWYLEALCNLLEQTQPAYRSRERKVGASDSSPPDTHGWHRSWRWAWLVPAPVASSCETIAR